MNDTKQIEDTLDRVEELAEQYKESFGEQFDGEPYGLNALTDEEHAAWFESWVRKFPPEAFKTKDGQIVIGSPWVLMLQFCENGEEELTRYNKTRGIGNGASRMPQEQEVM